MLKKLTSLVGSTLGAFIPRPQDLTAAGAIEILKKLADKLFDSGVLNDDELERIRVRVGGGLTLNTKSLFAAAVILVENTNQNALDEFLRRVAMLTDKAQDELRLMLLGITDFSITAGTIVITDESEVVRRVNNAAIMIQTIGNWTDDQPWMQYCNLNNLKFAGTTTPNRVMEAMRGVRSRLSQFNADINAYLMNSGAVAASERHRQLAGDALTQALKNLNNQNQNP